jgi:GNAT superfamily N-acetyltransferase
VSLRVEEATPASWPDIERLFGPKGACAGCWCMFWREEKGERVRGPEARRRFRALVASGEARGVLAYDDAGEPVGWAALGKKSGFARLARSPSLRTGDDPVALPCFFVKPGQRGKGVATALLEGALDAVRRDGGGTLEAYPVQGEKLANAFAWTGVRPMFERAGFRLAGEERKGKVRMRKRVRARG